MNKTIVALGTAVAGIEDGMIVMVGGFGGSGAPIELIHALIDRIKTGHPKNLTVINNNAGNGHVGIAAMIEAGHGQEDDLLVSRALPIRRCSPTDIWPAGSNWS